MVLDDYNMDVADARRYIFRHLMGESDLVIPAQLICHSGRNLEFVQSDDINIVRGLYGRHTFAACRPWSFSVGDSLTFVVFHSPVDPEKFTYRHDTSRTGGLPDWNHVFAALYYTQAAKNLSNLRLAVGGHSSYLLAKTSLASLAASLAQRLSGRFNRTGPSTVSLFFPEDVFAPRIRSP